MRPGKPLAFGSFEGVPLDWAAWQPGLGLCGLQVFVLPALYKLAGRERSVSTA